MKKRFLVLLCLIALICLGMIGTALTDGVVTVTFSNGFTKDYDGLHAAIEDDENSTEANPIYTLRQSFTVGREIVKTGGTLNMEGCKLTIEQNNSVTFQGVKINNGTFEVLSGATLNFSSVTYDLQGKGPIIVNNKGMLIADRSELRNGNNTTTTTTILNDRTALEGKGGAIHAKAGSSVRLTDCKFQNNVANYGGAIYIYGFYGPKTDSKLTIDKCTFTNNRAEPNQSPRRGGAIYIDNQKATITDSLFQGNRSLHGGGAIYLIGRKQDDRTSGVLEVYGTIFEQNISGYRGGAITVSEFSSAKFLDNNGRPTQFIGNELTEAKDFAGGGLFIDRSYVYMEDVLITGNSARDAGGGISTCGTGTVDVYPLEGAMIYGNSVTGSGLDRAKELPDVYFATKDHYDYHTNQHVDGRDGYSTVGMKYELVDRMFNGGLHRWTVRNFFSHVASEESDPDVIRTDPNFHSLIAKSDPTFTSGESKAKVIFRGNRAITQGATKPVSGGAIADNGLLEIGNTRNTDEVKILKLWELDEPSVRPDPESLLSHITLYGAGDRLGTLKDLKDDGIFVEVLTGRDAASIDPYSDVVMADDIDLSEYYDEDRQWKLKENTFWVIIVSGLEKLADNARYTVREDAVVDARTISGKDQLEYTSSVIKDLVLKNTLNLTSIEATKVWNDAGHENRRPESITIRLHQNGLVIDSKEVTADEDWKVTFKDLPIFDEEGTRNIYNVSEDHVKNYTHHIDEETHTITNTYNPGKTDVEVEKAWLDDHDQEHLRPAEVVVHLYANGHNTGRKLTLSRENRWFGEFEAVDEKDAHGHLIKYTIREDRPEGYKAYVTGDMEKGFVLINTTHADDSLGLPATGDPANPLLWGLLTGASLLILAALIMRLRKRWRN